MLSNYVLRYCELSEQAEYSRRGIVLKQEDIEILSNDAIPEPVRTAIAQSILRSADEVLSHEIETKKLEIERRKFIWNTPIVAALAGLVTLSATFIFDRISSREQTESTITLEQVKQEL